MFCRGFVAFGIAVFGIVCADDRIFGFGNIGDGVGRTKVRLVVWPNRKQGAGNIVGLNRANGVGNIVMPSTNSATLPSRSTSTSIASSTASDNSTTETTLSRPTSTTRIPVAPVSNRNRSRDDRDSKMAVGFASDEDSGRMAEDGQSRLKSGSGGIPRLKSGSGG